MVLCPVTSASSLVFTMKALWAGPPTSREAEVRGGSLTMLMLQKSSLVPMCRVTPWWGHHAFLPGLSCDLTLAPCLPDAAWLGDIVARLLFPGSGYMSLGVPEPPGGSWLVFLPTSCEILVSWQEHMENEGLAPQPLPHSAREH